MSIYPDNHFDSYAFLNDQLLMLIMSDKGESKESNVVRDEMDFHWSEMNSAERDLMRKRNEQRLRN